MKYYLGIDGGGSKTSFCVIDEENNLVFETSSAGSSIDSVALEATYLHIVEVANKIPFVFSGIHLGLGGVNSEEDKEMLLDLLGDIKNVQDDVVLSVSNDIENLYYLAFKDQEGIVLISGTGSVCLGKNKNKTVRVGGYGYKEGDFGSAYMVGLKALQLTCQYLDKRNKYSPLGRAILKELDIYSYQQMVNYINNASRKDIASLAKTVTSHHTYKEAKHILNEQADELVKHLKSANDQLHFNGRFNYCIDGGLGKDDTFNKIFTSKMKRAFPKAKKIINQDLISYGASLIAKSNYEKML